ncbi:MAG TPA: SET domain-containing protein-lysine N-methyltransferase [Verrucomicrobiae bacterium]|nr:SET domain-containing protein-lysine N-methyltransferase [Verrucomicrobiae bacterium]
MPDGDESAIDSGKNCRGAPSRPPGERRVCYKTKLSSIHGLGLFASESLPHGAKVIEYRGELISKQESLDRCAGGNHAIFYWSDAEDLDGSVEWNPARHANHSCAPNCEARRLPDGIWLVALRDIGPGEELTFDYGYDLVDYREHPCRCGAPGCAGFIVANGLREHILKYRF